MLIGHHSPVYYAHGVQPGVVHACAVQLKAFVKMAQLGIAQAGKLDTTLILESACSLFIGTSPKCRNMDTRITEGEMVVTFV